MFVSMVTCFDIPKVSHSRMFFNKPYSWSCTPLLCWHSCRAAGTYGDMGFVLDSLFNYELALFQSRGRLGLPHRLAPTKSFDISALLQSIPWFGGGLLFYGAKANNGSIISCFEEEKKTLLLFFWSHPELNCKVGVPRQYTEVNLLPVPFIWVSFGNYLQQNL